MIKTEDCEEIKRYTRGSSVAEINSLLFNNKSQFLTATSNLETIHVFTVPIVQWDKNLAESQIDPDSSITTSVVQSEIQDEKDSQPSQGYTPFFGRFLPFSTVYENEHSYCKFSSKGDSEKLGFVNQDGKVVVINHSLKLSVGALTEGLVKEDIEEVELQI